MTSVPLNVIVNFLDEILEAPRYKDSAFNGVQVESPPFSSEQVNVRTVAFAVDAGLSCIKEAVAQKADILIVHHGLFWGDITCITGSLAEKIHVLQSYQCTLYASHLPLDGHKIYGNGAALLKFLGAKNITPFAEHKGASVGAQGSFQVPLALSSIAEKLTTIEGFTHNLILSFGKQTIKTIAAVTGSGTFGISEAKSKGIDLFVSGEPKHEAYHLAKEQAQSVVFSGHYATETFGLRALEKLVSETFGVKCIFIAEPSGI
jgi:dinuclear metal center YbgI/SA1388 family protein